MSHCDTRQNVNSVSFSADGVTYSFGVFYDVFLDYFNEGKGATSWVNSILVGVTLCSGMNQVSFYQLLVLISIICHVKADLACDNKNWTRNFFLLVEELSTLIVKIAADLKTVLIRAVFSLRSYLKMSFWDSHIVSISHVKLNAFIEGILGLLFATKNRNCACWKLKVKLFIYAGDVSG